MFLRRKPSSRDDFNHRDTVEKSTKNDETPWPVSEFDFKIGKYGFANKVRYRFSAFGVDEGSLHSRARMNDYAIDLEWQDIIDCIRVFARYGGNEESRRLSAYYDHMVEYNLKSKRRLVFMFDETPAA